MDEITLRYNAETKKWEPRKEPYCTIECPTKEDYDRFVEMLEFWQEHHKDGDSDAVPVVWCKDCKHFWGEEPAPVCRCNNLRGLVDARTDTFCSYGERRGG